MTTKIGKFLPEFYLATRLFILANVILFSVHAHEPVFIVRKLDNGDRLAFVRTLEWEHVPTEAEKNELEAQKKTGIFSLPENHSYRNSLWLVKANDADNREMYWTYDGDFLIDGVDIVTYRWGYPFEICDAIVEDDSLVLVLSLKNKVWIEIDKQSKIIGESLIYKNACCAKIEGSMKDKSLSVTIDFINHQSKRIIWDGKEWIEEKKGAVDK